MKVKLIKLQSNHKEIRTDVVEGECDFLPIVGRILILTAESIDPNKDFRLITTSKIKTVEYCEPNIYFFSTANSTYKLEILNEQSYN